MTKGYTLMTWKVLCLIKEDRGKIPTSRRNGLPVFGQHQPYWNGMLVENTETGERFFLDPYNTEITLNHCMKPKTPIILPLQHLLTANPNLCQKIHVIKCNDTAAWVKHHQLNKLPRNAALMKTIAANLTISSMPNDSTKGSTLWEKS